MLLRTVWLRDFRSYAGVELALGPGLTAVLGENGRGKSNLLEAVGWLATTASFRGAPTEALVRAGAEQAVVRAEGDNQGRDLLVEAELGRGRARVLVNKQRLVRARDLLGTLRVTVFAPDDLELVKGGPSARRRYLDDALVALHPRNDALRADLDRVLRQRNSLLKQVQGGGSRLDASAELTLDVWDAKLAQVGEALARARAALVARLAPALVEAYAGVAVGSDARARASLRYAPPWSVAAGGPGLARALEEGRRDDVRRGVSLVGPHRDDLELVLGGLATRTHASQGEQRSLALALRLAAHAVVTDEVGSPPVLLLDDVFSELDERRSDALLAHLPAGQTLLSSASGLPPGAVPESVVHVEAVDAPAGGVTSRLVVGPGS